MKTVLITGSTSPLGKMFSEFFGRNGHFLYLQYRGFHHKVETILEKYRGEGVEFEFNKDNLKEWIKEISLIKPDILVNNFGPFLYKNFLELRIDEWEWIFFSNTTLTFFSSKEALKHMQNKGWGRIINVGFHNIGKLDKVFPNVLPYAISKEGIFLVTKTFSKFLEGSGITVNMISPTIVETEFYPEEKKFLKKSELFDLLKKIVDSGETGKNFFL